MALTNLPNTATLFDIVEKLKEKSVLDESDKELLKTKMDEVPIDYPEDAGLSDLIKIASLHLKEGGGTGGPVSWEEILNKPSTYPTTWNDVASKPSVFKPEAHNHNGDSLTPSNVGLVGTPVDSGYFDALFVNGEEVIPGGGSGGDVTYESVNTAITDKEINPNKITTTSDLSLTGGVQLIMQLSRSNGAGIRLGGSDGSVHLRKANVSTTLFNLGVQNEPIDTGYFKKIVLNGEELIPGGGSGEVTYEAVNGAITGKAINPSQVESGYLTVKGRNVINLYSGEGAMRLENNDGVTSLSPFRDACSIGRSDKRMDQGHFTTMMVNGVDIGTELTSQKASLIDSINAIKAVL